MKAAAILMLAALALPGTASAQSRFEAQTGSHLGVPRQARISDSADEATRGRAVLAQFARCVVDREQLKVRAAVALPAERTPSATWGRMASAECLGNGELRLHPVLLRGAIFAELYRRRLAGVSSGSVPSPAYDPAAAAPAEGGSPPSHLALLQFADCVVARDRDDAGAFVAATPAGKAEDAALLRLRPHLGPCVPDGQQVALSRGIIGGALAERLYRGAVVTSPATQQAAK